MYVKVKDEAPFQVLTGAFTIGPSQTGYELQVGATPADFATLFSVGANTTRMVTNVANGSYFRLKNNVGEVTVNWSRSCVTEGGSIDPSVLDEYWTSAQTVDYVEGVITSGVDLSNYWTSAQTQSAITEAVSGKADAKILVDFDHTSQAERAALYADLYDLYDGGSGATINRNYDFYKTVNTWQGLKIDYYGFSGDTLVFGKVVSPENLTDEVVYEQVMTIDSEGNVEVVTNSVGGADMSAYWTSAETENAISAATSGKADAANVTAIASGALPKWNTQGIITGVADNIQARNAKIDGSTFKFYSPEGFDFPPIYAPRSAGNAGEILVSTGGTPVWSAVTIPDMSAYYTSAQTESAITAVENHLYDVEEVTASALTELHNSVLVLSGRPTPDMTQYTPTSGFATVNGSAITNGGNIVIQGGGGGGGISQADLSSSGYLYFNFDGMGNTETNLDNTYDFLKGNDGDGYSIDPPQLVDYDADEDGNMAQTYGHPPFPKHLVTIYQSDYDDLVNNGGEDSETFYIVLPDPE